MTLLAGLPPGSMGLGTAGFAFGSASRDQALETIRVAVEGGIALIDSAPAYTRPGEESTAEGIVAEAVTRFSRSDVLIATKGGHWRSGDAFPIDGRPETLRRSCESSLRILGIDRIDLYLLHHVDPHVPLEDSVGALRDLQSDGLVRDIGLSNVTIDQVDAASRVADIAAVQNRLSLTHAAGVSLARECARRAIAYLAYSPLGGVGATAPAGVEAVARRHGVSNAQVQLAWLLAASDAIVPVIGATRPETVRDSLAAAAVTLTPADQSDLDGP